MLKNRVREFREKKEMTQTELASATKVTRQTIHSIENKNVVPSVEIAIRLAKAMRAKVEELFFISKKIRSTKP